MEYDHGNRITPLLHELTPLERAIVDFENKAKAHYSKPVSAPENETPEQKLIRERNSKKALDHLNREKIKALAMISVHTKLEEYRAELKPSSSSNRSDKKALREAMLQEKHHPTDILAKFMRASGRPQPSKNFTAHHVVQGKGKTDQAAITRVQLHFHNVRINDPDNGVWMPRYKRDKGHWAMPKAAAHSEIHTHNYEAWVFRQLRVVPSEVTLRAQLKRIRTLLRDGNQPKEVTQPPNKNWDGQ